MATKPLIQGLAILGVGAAAFWAFRRKPQIAIVEPVARDRFIASRQVPIFFTAQAVDAEGNDVSNLIEWRLAPNGIDFQPWFTPWQVGPITAIDPLSDLDILFFRMDAEITVDGVSAKDSIWVTLE